MVQNHSVENDIFNLEVITAISWKLCRDKLLIYFCFQESSPKLASGSAINDNKHSGMSKSFDIKHSPASSDHNLEQIIKSGAGERPRNLTFSFTNCYRNKRRRMSLGVHSMDNKTSSITHSIQLTFLDFIDLFKAFSLRCRRDLKDLFEELTLPCKPNSKEQPANKPLAYTPPSGDYCKCSFSQYQSQL